MESEQDIHVNEVVRAKTSETLTDIEGVDIVRVRDIINLLKRLDRSIQRLMSDASKKVGQVQSAEEKGKISRQTKVNIDYIKVKTADDLLALIPDERVR